MLQKLASRNWQTIGHHSQAALKWAAGAKNLWVTEA